MVIGNYLMMGVIVILIIIIAALLGEISKLKDEIDDYKEELDGLLDITDTVTVVLMDKNGNRKVFELDETDEV